MATIPLDRCFMEWHDDTDQQLSGRCKARMSHEPLAWYDLLAKRRVVILAEAGSGKTAELVQQATFAVPACAKAVRRTGLSDLRPLLLWRYLGRSCPGELHILEDALQVLVR